MEQQDPHGRGHGIAGRMTTFGPEDPRGVPDEVPQEDAEPDDQPDGET